MFRRSVLMLGLVVVLSQVAAPGTAIAQMAGLGRINGVVVDEEGTPLEGVQIQTKTALGAAIGAKSNAKGDWVVPGLGKGLWEVDFTKDGYRPVKAKVTLTAELARTEPIKIMLKKP